MLNIIAPQTEVHLLANTGINDYSNQIDFMNDGEQITWFKQHIIYSRTDYRFLRKESAIDININVELLYNVDYIMYRNNNFNGRMIYCFITQIEYINDMTTRIYVEVDAWQTFQFDISFHKSFIVRQHEDEFRQNIVTPARVLFNNLYPEGLDYGSDYITTHTETHFWSGFQILISSSADLTLEYGDTENPQLHSSTGGVIDGVPSALDYYVVSDGSVLSSLLSEISSAPWIGQCLQSLTIVPSELGANGTPVTTPGGVTLRKLQNGFHSANNASTMSILNPLQYFGTFEHDKLYAYPYSFIEMSAWNGQTFIIRPEALPYTNTPKLEIARVNFVGASPRLAYFVKDYNGDTDNGFEIGGLDLGGGESLLAGVMYGNFPQFPVMIDNYLLYQANNANSFELSRNIANYNKKEGVVLGGIETGANVISSLLSGNVGGAVNSLWKGGKSIYQSQKNNEIELRKLAAKIQDTEITPPTLSGTSGGDAFNIANGIGGFTLKWKTIRPQYRDRLTEYFTRYGYVTNKIDIPEYTGNKNFNYIQTSDVVITGDIPVEYIDIIKGMFNTGVTMWHNKDIGNYTTNPRG